MNNRIELSRELVQAVTGARNFAEVVCRGRHTWIEVPIPYSIGTQDEAV